MLNRIPTFLNGVIDLGFGIQRLGGIANGTDVNDAATVGQLQTDLQSQLFMQKTSVDEGNEIIVPEGYMAVAYGTYTVNGTLCIYGEMRIYD